MMCWMAGAGDGVSGGNSRYGELDSVCFVHSSSCFGLTGGIHDAVPPLPLSTQSGPSASARTAVGYQPVGMNPSTNPRSADTSTTAAALASEQATYNRLRSAESASAEGVMPSG